MNSHCSSLPLVSVSPGSGLPAPLPLCSKFLQALLSGPATPLPTFGGLSTEESVKIFCDLPSASGGSSSSPGHTEGTSAASQSPAPGAADTPSASELSTAGGGNSLCGSLVSDLPTLEGFGTAPQGTAGHQAGPSLSPFSGVGVTPPTAGVTPTPVGLLPPSPGVATGGQAGVLRKRTASAAFGQASEEGFLWVEAEAPLAERQGLGLAQSPAQGEGQEGECVSTAAPLTGSPPVEAFLGWDIPALQHPQLNPSAAQDPLITPDFAAAAFGDPFLPPSPAPPVAVAAGTAAAASSQGHFDTPFSGSSPSTAYLPTSQWSTAPPSPVTFVPTPVAGTLSAVAQFRPAARQQHLWTPQSLSTDTPWRAQRGPGGVSSIAASTTSPGQGSSQGSRGAGGSPLAAPFLIQGGEGVLQGEGGGAASVPGLGALGAGGHSEAGVREQLAPGTFSPLGALSVGPGTPETALLGMSRGAAQGSPLLTSSSPAPYPSAGVGSCHSPSFPSAGPHGSHEAALLALSTGAGSYAALAAERAAQWLERAEQDLTLPGEMHMPEVFSSWPILSLTMGSEGQPLAMSTQPESTLNYATPPFSTAPFQAPLGHTPAHPTGMPALAPSHPPPDMRPFPGPAPGEGWYRPLRPQQTRFRGQNPAHPGEQLTFSGAPPPSPFSAPQISRETPALAFGAAPASFLPRLQLPSQHSLGSSFGYQPRSPWHTTGAPLTSGPSSRTLHMPFMFSPGTPSSDQPLEGLSWGGRGLEAPELGVPISLPPGLPLALGPSVSWDTPGGGTPAVGTPGAGSGMDTPGAGALGVGPGWDTPSTGTPGAGPGVGTPGIGTHGTWAAGTGAGGVGSSGTGRTGARALGTGTPDAGAPRARLLHLPSGSRSPDGQSQPHVLAPGTSSWGSLFAGDQSPVQDQPLVPSETQRALPQGHVFPLLGEPQLPPCASWAHEAAGPAPHASLSAPGLRPLYNPLLLPGQTQATTLPVDVGGSQYNMYRSPSQRARISSPATLARCPGGGSPLRGSNLSREEVDALRSALRERTSSSERLGSQLETRLPE